MELLIESIKMDWPVLLPIFVCSILVVGVVINRFAYYNKNKRDVVQFIPRLQKELAKNNLDGAQNLAIQCGGVIGEVTEEAVRIFSEQKNMHDLYLIYKNGNQRNQSKHTKNNRMIYNCKYCKHAFPASFRYSSSDSSASVISYFSATDSR